jgi:hypothetical protein
VTLAPEPAAIDVEAALMTDAPPSAEELLEALLKGDPTLQVDEADDEGVEATPSQPRGPGRPLGSKGKRKVLKYSHKALADAMLLNPSIQGRQLATLFGRTPQWVYLVQSTDAFQAYLSRRQEDLVDPSIRATLNERAKALTLRSLEVMQEKLNRPVDAIPDQFALRAFELAAKATALGGNAPPPPAPNPGEFLPELARRLEALRSPAPQIVDVTSREVARQE